MSLKFITQLKLSIGEIILQESLDVTLEWKIKINWLTSIHKFRCVGISFRSTMHVLPKLRVAVNLSINSYGKNDVRGRNTYSCTMMMGY